MRKFLRIRLSTIAAGQNVAGYLARAGYPIAAECGGKGRCGKCRIKLSSGVLFSNPECTSLAQPDADGWYYACRVYGGYNAIILLPAQEGAGLTDFAGQKDSADTADATWGIALDIGTTTLAMALVNTVNGSVVATASALNPQKAYGADVISRIEAIMQHPETLGQMQTALLDKVCAMAQELLDGRSAERMIVAGNTTMLHIFCGVSPVSMGTYPFTPVFTNPREICGEELHLPVRAVTLLPSISAFVGGDTTAGMLHCRLTEQEKPTLLVDVGTNGETVLFTGNQHDGRLYAASAAAGPAMEGAGISTGMGGVRGAVCAIRLQNKLPICSTVDDAPAQGICGSGLIDLTAALYQNGIIDETGAFEAEDAFVYATTQEGAPLCLTQADIRALQLAKSAIRASIEALCAHAGLTPDDLDRIYLAGGLGYYMNVDSAIAIGLLPPACQGRTVSLGNASLGGCVQVLTDPRLIDRGADEASACQTLELSTDAVWNQAFMEHMMFHTGDKIGIRHEKS